MYVFQRNFQYFPDTSLTRPEDKGLTGFEVITIDTKDGARLINWYAPPGKTGKTIVYLQGNAEAIASRWERFELFRDQGYGVFALGYRGFGGSTGTPTEQGLMSDAAAGLDWLNTSGIAMDKIVLFGESLGTGIAIQLAARKAYSPAGVILESPYTSALAIARARYWFLPVRLLMKDQFLSTDHIASVHAPVFIFHGTQDAIIPLAHGRRIFAKANRPKQFVTVTGGTHVAPLTLPLWRLIDAFIKQPRACKSQCEKVI